MKKRGQLLMWILLLILVIIIGIGILFIFQSQKSQNQEYLCQISGGHWNNCSSKCALLYQQGDPTYYCEQKCESLCECGGIAGFQCPSGYNCILPNKTISDALGYCERQ